MIQTKLKIGFAGAVHPNMPGKDVELISATAAGLGQLSDDLDFTLISHDAPVRSERDGAAVRDLMNREAVDLFLLFSASLPYGRIALPLAQIDAPIGVWAVPEPTTSGVLQLNSFCGLNMVGSILRNYFVHDDIKYKWFYGAPDSAMFRERFDVTVRALRAVKALGRARIGQIGDLADGFENLHVDERDLRHKFGTTVQTRHTVEEIVRRAELYAQSDVEKYVGVVSGEGAWNREKVSGVHMEKLARLNMAFDALAEENEYDSLAISCWSRFQEVYDIAVCGAMSRLNNRGLVAPCEADITSAISMLMLNAMNGGRASLNDLVALDESDSSINLWHCGVAPGCWADSCGVTWDAHFNIGQYEGSEWNGSGVVADMQFQAGPVTVANLGNRFESAFVLTGSIMEGKKGFSGSSGWVNDLRINGAAVSIPDLVNTLSVAQVNHHYPAAQGNLDAELREFGFWKDVRIIDAVPYTPWMSSFV